MTATQLSWLAGFFIASITTNLGLLKIITDDKIRHSNRVSIITNNALSLVLGYFSYKLCGVYPAIAFIVFSYGLFFIMLCVVKKQYNTVVWLGESLLSEFKTIDLQICYILSEIHGNPTGDLTKPIRRTLRYILSNLQIIFGLDKTHRAQLCVLIPQNSMFKVVAYEGITPVRLQLMEETFRYGDAANCLAGHAVNRRSPIIINDLSNSENTDAGLFVKLSPDESKTGSAIAYPILRGLGSPTAEPIAVLCITSIKKQAFPIELTKQFLSYYSSKIEILHNCIDIAELIKR